MVHSIRLVAGKLAGAALILLVLLGLVAVNFGSGAGAARSAEDQWTHLIVHYHSDCKGKIEPCG